MHAFVFEVDDNFNVAHCADVMMSIAKSRNAASRQSRGSREFALFYTKDRGRTIQAMDGLLSVQISKDSDYYFRRNLEGAYDSSGVPFTPDASTFNVANKNCVIYGHRLDSGEDFGVLKSYLDQEFYNEHPCIYIETDSGTSEWDIISVFTINISTDSFAYTAYSDMADNSSRGVFLGEVRQRNLIDTVDYTYQTGDKLITLSTCHYETDIDNGRLVVVAAKRQ